MTWLYRRPLLIEPRCIWLLYKNSYIEKLRAKFHKKKQNFLKLPKKLLKVWTLLAPINGDTQN